MRYIFNGNNPLGEYPVSYFQILWYDAQRDNTCFDEEYISPKNFDSKYLAFIQTEDNKEDLDKARVFAVMKNGDVYEMLLKKIDNKSVKNLNIN